MPADSISTDPAVYVRLLQDRGWRLAAVALARLTEAESVEAVLARIPPNHAVTVELNERGELPGDPAELEAGANRCAVA